MFHVYPFFFFFDSKGVVHQEFVPPGGIVNAQFYLEVLDRVCKQIARVRHEMWKNQSFFFLHNNAPAHTATVVQQKPRLKTYGTHCLLATTAHL